MKSFFQQTHTNCFFFLYLNLTVYGVALVPQNLEHQ